MVVSMGVERITLVTVLRKYRVRAEDGPVTIRGLRPPTLADIAARAGTTVPTVSKVLNGRSDVSAATRSRVMQLVAETGYRRRGGSGRPPAGDQRLIDLVLASVSGGWANQVLIGVERSAAEAGLDLVVTVARPERARDRARSGDWVARLLARSSQGAVLALVDASVEELATLAAAGVPVVLLDPVHQPPDAVPSVGATNWPAGRDVAAHLLGLGHHRLGVLAGAADQLYSRARVDGFVSAVRLLGGGSDQDPDVRVVHTDGRVPAVELAERLLAGPDRPTALFACSDSLAFAVIEAAERRRLRIPEDLSLVGFDDLPEAAWAGLTTVRQPIAEMGAAALRLLLRLRGSLQPLPREELATTLVVRRTTAPPSAD